MTTHEVAESSSPLTHLERVVKWSARRQSRLPPSCSFPTRPWVPWDGVGWRQERGAEARLGRPLLLLPDHHNAGT